MVLTLMSNYYYLVCMWDQCGKMPLINHVLKCSHTLSFHSKIQINSGKIQINWNRQWAKWANCGLTVVGREQSNLTYNSTNYQCRKRVEWLDTQYCLLCHRPLLEGSKATWSTILSAATQTVVGREQSNLIDNTAYCYIECCRKGA